MFLKVYYTLRNKVSARDGKRHFARFLKGGGVRGGVLGEERMVKMKFDKGLMAGSGTMLVLSLLEKGDMYGYQMIEELSRRSSDLFQMKEGTLYPILHALEKDKCLSSYQQEAPTGRMRKYYKITRRGKQLLDDKRAEWAAFHQGVEQVLSGGANALA